MNFSFKNINLKMLSGKWQPFCLSLNVLKWLSFMIRVIGAMWMTSKDINTTTRAICQVPRELNHLSSKSYWTTENYFLHVAEWILGCGRSIFTADNHTLNQFMHARTIGECDVTMPVLRIGEMSKYQVRICESICKWFSLVTETIMKFIGESPQ